MSATTRISQNPVELTGAQRRHLRGLGHALKPVVRVGKNGVTEGVIEAAAVALDDHELIKLAVAGLTKADREADAGAIATATGSHFVQLLGGTALLYRRRLDDARVALPGSFVEARPSRAVVDSHAASPAPPPAEEPQR